MKCGRGRRGERHWGTCVSAGENRQMGRVGEKEEEWTEEREKHKELCRERQRSRLAGGQQEKGSEGRKNSRFGRVVVWKSVDCLWEREVCQPGTTLIGKWITTEVEINSVYVCLYRPV